MRKLISSDEAVGAKVQHRDPCSDCPLRRDSLNGWLGDTGSPEDWRAALHSDSRMDCHVLRGAQCAGAAIYRRNVCKSPRDKSILVLPSDRKTVFAGPHEFVKHHSRIPPEKVR